MFRECCRKWAGSGKVFGILQSKKCFWSAVGNGQVVGKTLVLHKAKSVFGVLSEMGRLWKILWYYTKLRLFGDAAGNQKVTERYLVLHKKQRVFWECCWKSEGRGKVFGITQSKECFGSAVGMNLCFDPSGN